MNHSFPLSGRGKFGLPAVFLAVFFAFYEGFGLPDLQKIDPLVLQNASNGPTEFFLFFNDQPDLSQTSKLKTKEEKGAYVFQTLTNRAALVQKSTLQSLKSRGLWHQPFWIANMILVRGDLEALRSFSAKPEVSRIVGNPPVPFSLPSSQSPRALNAAAAGVEWNISKVGAPDVWALGYKGQGIIIGGQDTGYEWTHPALKKHYRGWSLTTTNHNYSWHDSIHTNNPMNSGQNPLGYNLKVPVDDGDHGTHTMGTMVGDDGVGNQIGMAPEAKWIGCRNMERGWGNPASYAESFQWFLAPTDLNNANPDPSKAPDVINNSWYCPPEEGCFDPLIYQTIVRNLRAAGIVVVVSAGNSGPTCGTIKYAPEVYDESFAVGATDVNNLIASFSSRGPATIGTNVLIKPNVCAPGVNIRSSVPGGIYESGWNGTSMAGPHVAGLVALLLSAHPELKGQVDAVERIIEQTSIPLTSSQNCGGFSGSQIPNTTYGWGRIDALGALGLGDADRDGIPDWWEIWRNENRFSPADASADTDGDGASNLQEYVADTNPTDAKSYFHLASASVTNGMKLTISSSPRCFYTLLRNNDLSQGSWVPVTNAMEITGTGIDLVLLDPDFQPSVACFYRVSVRR